MRSILARLSKLVVLALFPLSAMAKDNPYAAKMAEAARKVSDATKTYGAGSPQVEQARGQALRDVGNVAAEQDRKTFDQLNKEHKTKNEGLKRQFGEKVKGNGASGTSKKKASKTTSSDSDGYESVGSGRRSRGGPSASKNTTGDMPTTGGSGVSAVSFGKSKSEGNSH